MKKILIVDDEPQNTMVLTTFFRNKGYQTRIAESCSDGLEVLYTYIPDIILLNLRVGGFDGREMCRQIRGQANFRHTPVIMIAASDDHVEPFESYGANSIVATPFDLAALQQLIDTNYSAVNN